MRPRISVITATRNVAATITALHGSLARQSYPRFEWIVADGHSRDATGELLRQFAAESPWLRFFSERDFGVYDALNKAITAASGEYYVVAGADDLFEEDALSRYAELVEGDRADVVFARVRRNSRVIGGFHPARAWIGTARVFTGSHSVGTLIRKDLHERFGFYSNRFPLLADVHFLKVLLRSGSVRFACADFIAGTFAEGGLTTASSLQILAENWQIQMLTERFRLVQTLLFAGKILVRWPALTAEIRSARRRRDPAGLRA